MLAADLDDDIRNWERGVTMIGPNQYREMTSAERETSLQSILQRLADMSEMDPRDSLKGVGELRKRIGNIYETKTGEKLPNQPPLRMPVGGTPAADAPVAPPPGIAGR
jgi:hypothetical protein